MTRPCWGMGDLFFGPDGERPAARARREAQARAICRTCPARTRDACGRLAADTDAQWRTWGVWAGLAPTERRELAASA